MFVYLSASVCIGTFMCRHKEAEPEENLKIT
jgi:hypothetical protein